MCRTCGCSEDVNGSSHRHEQPGEHGHDHAHDHDQAPTAATTVRVPLGRRVMERNDGLADANRRRLRTGGVCAVNLMSGPGAGKTTLLERTLSDLGAELVIAVIEGDQATDRDAARIRTAGGRAIQINTGSGCHLDATMVARALDDLGPAAGSVVVIENVGNLVCPALFDLGERAKVTVVSVTDGDDKPLKYPHMFRASDLMLLNKVDLLPHVRFDVERCVGYARMVSPRLEILPISATRGDGLPGWYAWLRNRSAEARREAALGT